MSSLRRGLKGCNLRSISVWVLICKVLADCVHFVFLCAVLVLALLGCSRLVMACQDGNAYEPFGCISLPVVLSGEVKASRESRVFLFFPFLLGSDCWFLGIVAT